MAAAGLQWWWCAAQSLCLLVSVVLDPLLIPWAQRTFGNGGLGVTISIAAAEIAMVSSGLWLLPRGVVDRTLGRTCLRCLIAAAAMAAIGLPLRDIPILAIPACVVVYVAVLWLVREVDSDLLTLMPPTLSRRLRWLQRN